MRKHGRHRYSPHITGCFFKRLFQTEIKKNIHNVQSAGLNGEWRIVYRILFPKFETHDTLRFKYFLRYSTSSLHSGKNSESRHFGNGSFDQRFAHRFNWSSRVSWFAWRTISSGVIRIEYYTGNINFLLI